MTVISAVTTLLHQLLFFSEQKYYHWVSDKIAAVYTKFGPFDEVISTKEYGAFRGERTRTSAFKLGLKRISEIENDINN